MSSLDGYKLIIDHNLNSNFKGYYQDTPPVNYIDATPIGLLSWSDKMVYFINWLKKQVLLIRYVT